MIPFAALCALIMSGGSCTEASVEELSVEGFTLRLPEGFHPAGNVELRFHRLHETLVWQSKTAMTPAACGGSDGLSLWRYACSDDAYRRFAHTFMAESIRYTQLKTDCTEAEAAQTLVGYDAAVDEAFAADLAAQRAVWTESLHADSLWNAALDRCSVAVRLDTPRRTTDWLSLGEEAFRAQYYAAFGLAEHPLARKPFTHICVGSPFCPELMPEADTLTRLLCGSTPVTVTLAPVPQGMLEEHRRLIHALPDNTEVEVNDWGMAALVHHAGRLRLTLGPLLLRRRRDPRLPLMGYPADKLALMGTTAAEDDAFAAYLRDALDVQRVTLEACGLPNSTSPFPQSVVLPFYQLNTAARCTLRAVCETGDRARQAPHGHCPVHCREHCFLYPQGSSVIGIGSTLLGFDRRSLTDGAYLASLLRGSDRIIIDLV